MKNHQELHKLVVATLEFHGNKGNYPTAKEMYKEIKEIKPTIVRKYEFKSFVKIINFFPEIKEIHDYPQRYALKI
jgi:hypothetical protein